MLERDLDKALAPPRGRVVNWSYFFVLYLVILFVAVIGVYTWDTNEKFRGFFGTRWVKKGGDVEGVYSSYFRSQWKGGWLCALPWILGFVVFTGGPILFSIVISFCDFDILNPARFIGTTNYRWMFTNDPLFWKSMWNTVFMVLGVPLGMAIGLGIASGVTPGTGLCTAIIGGFLVSALGGSRVQIGGPTGDCGIETEQPVKIRVVSPLCLGSCGACSIS